jgi:hypothetical protein
MSAKDSSVVTVNSQNCEVIYDGEKWEGIKKLKYWYNTDYKFLYSIGSYWPLGTNTGTRSVTGQIVSQALNNDIEKKIEENENKVVQLLIRLLEPDSDKAVSTVVIDGIQFIKKNFELDASDNLFVINDFIAKKLRMER